MHFKKLSIPNVRINLRKNKQLQSKISGLVEQIAYWGKGAVTIILQEHDGSALAQ